MPIKELTVLSYHPMNQFNNGIGIIMICLYPASAFPCHAYIGMA